VEKKTHFTQIRFGEENWVPLLKQINIERFSFVTKHLVQDQGVEFVKLSCNIVLGLFEFWTNFLDICWFFGFLGYIFPTEGFLALTMNH
jgi:hypothetical protein